MSNWVRIRERAADYEPPTYAFPLMFALGCAFLLAMVVVAVTRGGTTRMTITIVVAALYVLTARVLWNLADKLRRYAMPTGYRVTDFPALVRTKLFWTIGPQCFPLLVYGVVSLFAACSKNP